MCVISAIWMNLQENVSAQQWTPSIYEQFKKVKEEVAKLDKMLGQADCEDAKKAEYEAAIQAELNKPEHIRQAEARLSEMAQQIAQHRTIP